MNTETRQLQLDCGGRVLLEVEADWLHMSDDDLAFVRGLARSIDDHRAGVVEVPLTPASPPPAPAPSLIIEPEPPVVVSESDDPLERYYTAPRVGDLRKRPWRCDCGKTGTGTGGLRQHLDAHDREAMPAPPRVRLAEPGTRHVLAEKLHQGHEHATRCSCGWESPWCEYPGIAAELLHEHVDEAEKAA